MHLSWCPLTWYSAWCSLTITPASLGPAFHTHLILHILRAKKAPPSTLSQLQTERIVPKAGTHETNKSMCPSKALSLFVSVNCACQQSCPVCCFSGFRQIVPRLAVDECMFVWMCMFLSLVVFENNDLFRVLPCWTGVAPNRGQCKRIPRLLHLLRPPCTELFCFSSCRFSRQY